MSKEVRIVVGIVLGLALAVLAFKLLRPFWPSLGWGLLLALLLDPVQQRLRKRMNRPFWPAFLTTALALVLVVVPISLLLIRLTTEISTAYPAVRAQVESLQKEALQQGSGYQVFLAKATPILAHYGVKFSAVTSFFADKIAGLAQGFFADTMKFLFDLFFTLIFIYVFLMHGRDLSAQAARLLPMQEDRKLQLFGRLRNFTLATFHGIFFTAFIQGALGFIGYRLFGLPAPLFFGTLTALFSLIPAGGAMLVWGPLVLFLLFTGETLKGILLLVWGAVLVSGADNVLRPLLIAGRTSVNAVFVLVSAVGGAAAFGVIGLFYGPILLFLTQEIVRLISERGAAPADPPGESA